MKETIVLKLKVYGIFISFLLNVAHYYYFAENKGSFLFRQFFSILPYNKRSSRFIFTSFCMYLFVLFGVVQIVILLLQLKMFKGYYSSIAKFAFFNFLRMKSLNMKTFLGPLQRHIKFFPVNHILTPFLCAKLKYDDENFFWIAQGNMRKHGIKTCESKKRGMFNFLCLTSVKMYLHFIGA